MWNVTRTPAFYVPAEAERIAASLNGTDDRTYTVRYHPCGRGCGYAVIDIFDENSRYITTM